MESAIIILSTELNQRKGPDYIARKEFSKETLNHREEIIEKAATYLREEVNFHVNNLEEIVCPPTIEQLSSEEENLHNWV